MADLREDIEFARTILRLEAAVLHAQEPLIDESFGRAVELVLACRGHVVATGMGKSGIIAQKLSATLASTGTPSFFLHPAEAIHGDLGRVTGEDLLIAISRSGETEEIRRLIPAVKRMGAPLLALTAGRESDLARHADCVLLLASAPEACPIGLAPTTSTTAQLALGDALAMTVAKRRKFTREEFALYHPGGELGRTLLKVADLMRSARDCPPAVAGQPARQALIQAGGLGRKPGALPVVDSAGVLLGLLTDGDVRRLVLRDPSLLARPIEELMTRNPATVREDHLAAEAWKTMRERNFDELPVVDARGRYAGLLDVQDLLEAGITGGA
ncbi:MAG: KpsF/GutQ family sugar-phosphate isomerase [Planctomycetaceae bacterium]